MALPPHPDLLEDPHGGGIADIARGPDAVQGQTPEAEGQEGAHGFGGKAVAPRLAVEDVAEVTAFVGGTADLDPAAADQTAVGPKNDGQVVDGPGDGVPGRPCRGQKLRGVLDGIRPPVDESEPRLPEGRRDARVRDFLKDGPSP
jgi:hypothetical protein